MMLGTRARWAVAILVALALVACGGGDDDDADETSGGDSSTTEGTDGGDDGEGGDDGDAAAEYPCLLTVDEISEALAGEYADGRVELNGSGDPPPDQQRGDECFWAAADVQDADVLPVFINVQTPEHDLGEPAATFEARKSAPNSTLTDVEIGDDAYVLRIDDPTLGVHSANVQVLVGDDLFTLQVFGGRDATSADLSTAEVTDEQAAAAVELAKLAVGRL